MIGFDFQVSIGDDMSLMFEAFQPEILEHWPQTAAHRLIRGLWLNVSSPLNSSHSCSAPTPIDAVHVIHQTSLSLTILGWYTLWALLLLPSLDKAGLFDYSYRYRASFPNRIRHDRQCFAVAVVIPPVAPEPNTETL